MRSTRWSRAVVTCGWAVAFACAHQTPTPQASLPQNAASTAATAPAATATGDSVPRDLATTLLAAARGDVVLRVGQAADAVPPELLRNFVVRGSAAYGPYSSTVIEVPFSERMTLDTVEARLLALGWKHPTAPRIFQRGFVSQSAGPDLSNSFCLGTDNISYSWRALLPKRTQLTLTYVRPRGGMETFCTDPAQSSARPRLWSEDAPIPVLVAPAGTSVQGSGSSGSGEDYTIRAQLRAQLRAGDILRHYAAQLKEQGWITGDNAGTPSAAMQTFSKTTPDGKSYFAVLTVAVPPGQPSARLEFTIHKL